MTEPPSRQYEAHKANNGGSHDEYDPHGVAARDMVAECPDCAARDGMGPPWYGSNPWSAPTTAQSLDFVMESGTNILGVCGASPSNKLNNYNTPLDGHWGMSAKTTYKAGDVIDVAWYLNGKVGGIMFWAVNEGARAPNGKTTGENSVALANYAAAL